VLTIGVFDGVHLGHQHLISRLKEKSRDAGLLSGLITFNYHPKALLAPQTELPYLTSLEDRIELIQALGVDHVIVLSFTNELAQLSAQGFISLLKKYLRMRGLVIGPDFALGRAREGNTEVLRSLGQELDFAVEVVPPVMIGEEVISSTAIRQRLAEGDVKNVTRMLGRRFRLSGTVVHGDHRGGALLGFPTANLAIPGNHVLPADGIYFTLAHLKDAVYRAATSIGVRPTFNSRERTVETYILDFNGDLYGHELAIEFVRRLRGEMWFETPEALKAQMESDITIAKALPIE
jgi:riboflavin kinase/FMN adenylyltransferase